MARTSPGRTISKRLQSSAALFPWEEYLKVKDKGNQLDRFNGNLDILEAKIITKSISKLVGSLEMSEDKKNAISSSMKTIIVVYSKITKQPFTKNNGWVELLLPLMLIEHPQPVIYNLFEAIRQQHVPYPNNCEYTLALLFLYHDPQLAQFIIRKRVSYHEFCKEWVSTLFASICQEEVLFTFWKALFRREEPMIFYLVLVIVINNREQILSMKEENKDVITRTISFLPKFVNATDIGHFFTAADYYKKGTPFSFEVEFFMPTFGIPEKQKPLTEASSYICLPVLADELEVAGNIVKSREHSKYIQFLVVDLRSAKEFEAGHFPNAINLDFSIHFQNPALFADKVEELLKMQPLEEKELNSDFDLHFCFVTSGRNEDDGNLLTFMDPILDAQLKYICIVKKGYKAIHDFYKEDLDKLENHNSEECLLCRPSSQRPKSLEPTKDKSFFNRLKRLSQIEKISNDPATSQSSSSQVVRDFRIVSVESYVDYTPIKHFILCYLVTGPDEKHKCWISMTQTHFEVLRAIGSRPGLAFIIVKRPYSEIMKISSPLDQPEILRLTFGKNQGRFKIVYEKIKLFVPHPPDIGLIRNVVISDMEVSNS